MSLWHRKLGPIKFKWDPVALRNLKQLRLVVDRKDFGEEWTRKGGLHLEACVWHSLTPNLKVLEINAPCDLSFNMDSALPLTSLVLIAAGTLDLDLAVWEKLEAWKTTLQQIYLQSSSAYLPSRIKGPLQNVVYFREEQHRYKACMPTNFHPNSLQDCCCKACSECLARADVPLLCSQAWTRDGFRRHLRS